LYKLRSKLSLDWLKLIYFAFVYPYILYEIEIYANTFITYLDTLTKLNNKILQIILNQPFRSHALDLYRQCDLLPLNYLHTHQLLILVFKCMYHRHLVPSTFHDYFSYNKDIHSHSMRTSNNLHMITPNTTFGKRCTKYKCTVLWNDLPDSLKVYCTVKKFKTHSKKYFFSVCW